MFRDRVLDPLCKDIETDLRLQVHSHLRVGDGDSNGLQNPFKSGNSASICDLSTFLQVGSGKIYLWWSTGWSIWSRGGFLKNVVHIITPNLSIWSEFKKSKFQKFHLTCFHQVFHQMLGYPPHFIVNMGISLHFYGTYSLHFSPD